MTFTDGVWSPPLHPLPNPSSDSLLKVSQPKQPPKPQHETQVKEISNQMAPEPFRWTAEAMLAMQEVSGAQGSLQG